MLLRSGWWTVWAAYDWGRCVRCQLRGHEAMVVWWPESRRHGGGDWEQLHPRRHVEASRAAENPSAPSLWLWLRASGLAAEETRKKPAGAAGAAFCLGPRRAQETKWSSCLGLRWSPQHCLPGPCYSQHPRILHLKTASCLTSSLGQRAQESSFMDEQARTWKCRLVSPCFTKASETLP